MTTDVIIYARTIEQEALDQISRMASSPLGQDAHIRIMPDAHAGAGCVIGTTMKISDKVCPNLVGVDIGCGVDLVKTNINFEQRQEELDAVIRKHIPYGMSVHDTEIPYDFQRLRCWNNLPKEVQERAKCALGTLGGGNHFIEAYKDGYLSVHSGSRNIGKAVADYYQKIAEKSTSMRIRRKIREELQKIPPKDREAWFRECNLKGKPDDLAYLTGLGMEDYLHDVAIMQDFANRNRARILGTITLMMNGEVLEHISSIHNYIEIDTMILRKGAISAKAGEILVIPLNMRDGLLICEGKGNSEWNYSAPHGAGRLYSRSKAKSTFTVSEYAKSMEGIFSTCINEETLDEAPFAYKDYEEIMDAIEPTVTIKDRLIPIFNFKAN